MVVTLMPGARIAFSTIFLTWCQQRFDTLSKSLYFYLKATCIMFLALRELAFAKGRFSLMGAVIALIAILTVLLSGLSSGLVNDGVSGVTSMPVSEFALDEATKTDNALSRPLIQDHPVIALPDPPGTTPAAPIRSPR